MSKTQFPVADKNVTAYFRNLQKQVQRIHEVAAQSRSMGLDPSLEVEVQRAQNLPQRVIGLLSVMYPQMRDGDIEKRMHELEEMYSKLDWRVACIIAQEVAEQKFCDFSSKLEAIEAGIRTGFAYITLGVVSAPIEGFTRVEIRERKDGKKYLALMYSGPIRNAGGTSAAVSALIADYVRVHMGYAAYDATDEEVGRVVHELTLYDQRVTNLQYNPTREELEFLVQNLPVQIDGDPTERVEVAQYRDMERVKSNRLRSGVCLMLSSCIPLKAPKLWKNLQMWGKHIGLGHWSFLKEMIDIQIRHKSQQKETTEHTQGAVANYSFAQYTVGGRPLLSYPMHKVGFRLPYERSRTNG